MFFGDDFLDRLSNRLDIVEVVSKYVHIERKGQNYFGLCPFHAEKTPSFSVSQERQIFKCFGCGAGGGAINFVMRIENLEFSDAVEMLAKEVNLPLPDRDQAAGETRKRLERLHAVNAEAAKHFYKNLASNEGKAAFEYIKKRGIKPDTLKKFALGFSKNSWDDLLKALTAKGFGESELVELGLVVRGERGLHDRFRNRLMFPIIDVRGNVIGFGGRVMDDSMPKYLNSSDSLAFNKSRNLYGLNIAKNSASGRMILAEGYMDVIALHQAGFDSAVASLGTSLTPDQARILGRYSKEICISYDADEAGKNAARRAVDVMKPFGYSVKVLRIPDGKDPDEFIKRHGARAYEALLEASEYGTEYRLNELADRYNFEIGEQRVEFVQAAAALLAAAESRAEIEVYADMAARLAKVSREAIMSEVARSARALKRRAEGTQRRKDVGAAAAVQPSVRGARYENVRSARAEEGILAAICMKPALFLQINDKITTENFSSRQLGEIFALLAARIEAGQSCDLPALTGELNPQQMDLIAKILIEVPSEGELERKLDNCVDIVLLASESVRGSPDEPDPLRAAAARHKDKKGYGG